MGDVPGESEMVQSHKLCKLVLLSTLKSNGSTALRDAGGSTALLSFTFAHLIRC